jgi:hypothetical protein
MSKYHHLLSQTSLKILVACFVCIPKRVKHAGPSIPRIDYESNPVAHDALPPPFTQYRNDMLKYDKS